MRLKKVKGAQEKIDKSVSINLQRLLEKIINKIFI